jgi:integrase
MNKPDRITDATIRSLIKSPPPRQLDVFDNPTHGGVRGLFVKVSPGGTCAFNLMWYLEGKSKVKKLGRYPELSLAAARDKATKLKAALIEDPNYFANKEQEEADAEAAAKAKLVTFNAVYEIWAKRYLDKQGIRSGRVMKQIAEKHLKPTFGEMEFATIKRGRIIELLEKIEDDHGPHMADAVLAVYRSMAKFQALRDSEYNSPLVRGMRRAKVKPRERVLDDNEIRAFWIASGKLGTYGALARVCLLTGQRRTKVVTMRWADIRDGVWLLDKEDREKRNAGRIKLAPLALQIISAQPRFDKSEYVFTSAHRRRRPFNAFGQFALKLTELERAIIHDMPSHTIHDLRRTFRTKCSENYGDTITVTVLDRNSRNSVRGQTDANDPLRTCPRPAPIQTVRKRYSGLGAVMLVPAR